MCIFFSFQYDCVVVSKPKEIAHKFKNKFGSADNIDNTGKLFETFKIFKPIFSLN